MRSVGRRRVVHANFAACFPALSEAERRKLARQTFVYFSQAWLDRAWLWHGPQAWVRQRVTLTGAVHELAGTEPTVIFLPHFVGLDAAWAGVALAGFLAGSGVGWKAGRLYSGHEVAVAERAQHQAGTSVC
mgnify:CR=1 FL=1